MARCKAIQYSDQMNCTACGLVWDVNDPDPPPCKTVEEQKTINVERNPYRLAKYGY